MRSSLSQDDMMRLIEEDDYSTDVVEADEITVGGAVVQMSTYLTERTVDHRKDKVHPVVTEATRRMIERMRTISPPLLPPGPPPLQERRVAVDEPACIRSTAYDSRGGVVEKWTCELVDRHKGPCSVVPYKGVRKAERIVRESNRLSYVSP